VGRAYGHSWFVDPANELTVVALTNTAFEGMSGAFPREIRDAVYRQKQCLPSSSKDLDRVLNVSSRYLRFAGST
jgi:CubicO group peptidase (beta-lactamase class C family)